MMNMDSKSGELVGNVHELISNFGDVIGIVFSNWTALKLSVEHGMAGPPVVVDRKLQSMVDHVSQILASSNAEWNDVSDYLDDTMNSDFSTILEDESNVDVAVHICKLHKIFCAGDFSELISNIKSMPHQTPINASLPVQRLKPQDCKMGEESEEVDNHVNDDGWTLVKKN